MRNNACLAWQRGASMIEVLVAILIFAFGMLGLASLQGTVLRYQQGAWARAVVANLTDDLMERIRANLAGARNNQYVYSANYAVASRVAAPGPTTLCSANSTSAQIASCDLAEWTYNVTRQLPGGAGNITGSLASGLTVTVMWADKEFAQTSTTCSPAINPAERRICCPASTPAGVRCTNTVFFP